MAVQKKATSSKTRTEAERVLYPGTQLSMHDGKLKIEVYPLSARQIEKFTKLIEEIAPRLQSSGMTIDQAMRDWRTALISIAPMIVSPMCDMLEDCCVITAPEGLSFDSLAHYDLAQVVTAWVDESFGAEGKARPWITVVETVIHRLTGQSVQIWETLSKHLSNVDTPAETSSIGVSPDSLIGAGPRLKSGIGSDEQPE